MLMVPSAACSETWSAPREPSAAAFDSGFNSKSVFYASFMGFMKKPRCSICKV
jgi:hypothetical protein